MHTSLISRAFYILALFLSFESWTGQAATVIEVLPDSGKVKVDTSASSFKSGSVVCLVRGNQKIGCGLLAIMKKGSGIVSLDFQNEPPQVGDEVISPALAKQREKAQQGAAVQATVTQEKDLFHIEENGYIHYTHLSRRQWYLASVGYWDLDQFSVGGQIEHFLSSRVSYGLQATVFDVTKKFTTLSGASLSIHRVFRPNREFSGVFVGLGVGAYIFSAPGHSVQLEPTAQAYVGWGLRINQTFRFGPYIGMLFSSCPKGFGADVAVFYSLRPNFGLTLSAVL